jgi:acyl dehydratase
MNEDWPLTSADLQWLHTDPVSAKKDMRKNSSIEKG